MSYGVEPFAVDLSQVRQAIGSNDELLYALLRGRLARQIEDEKNSLDVEEGELSFEDALKNVISGAKLVDRYWGHKYGYILNALCWQLGKFLSNASWTSMRWEWAEKVDQAVKDAGVSPNKLGIVWHLFTRGSPVPIPPIDDFPMIGYLLKTETSAALTALSAGIPGIQDSGIKESAEQVIDWLSTCVKSDRDLVTFYF